MRAPFCNDSTDLCPDDKGVILSENESEREIHAIERSLGRAPGKKTAVFGVCLDDLMGTTSQVVPKIPFILSRLCRYIETHGLRHKRLFLEGDEKNVVENLKVEFMECGDACLESADNVASAAKLLILFFEELPEPLIPASAQIDFVKDMEKLSLSSSDLITHLKHNVGKLSESAYQILKYLACFLLQVSCHEEYNEMNSNNLAFIFSPLIFRSTSNDPAVHLKLKDVVNYFVQDYHLIFEDAKTSLNEGKQNATVKSSTRVYQHPCATSVMPAMSLSPLSVFIPSMDTSVADENETKDSVPVLLIETEFDVPASEIVRPKKLPTCIKDIGTSVTRKRKERRLSGEDSQPRSSSEERPTQSSLVSLERMDILRRCNSHEGVDSKVEEEDVFAKDIRDKGDSSSQVDSYLSETMELVLNEKNHSPHPPNAKRREVDTDRSNMDSPSDHWKLSSLSSFNEYKNSQSDMPCWRDSKQNPTAEEKPTMDFNEGDDEHTSVDSARSSIPRSASCPVPNSDHETNSDSQSSSLSMSWSMLFEDTEPVRSEQPLGWSLSKEVQDDALLSPSVQKLRSNNNFYEAPLSPSAYRSYLSHRSSHLDPSVPPSPPVEQEDFAKKLVESSGVSDSIKHLTKKIHNIKRRVRKFDEKFEAEFGYKPSHAEKSNNPEAKKLLSDLYKARKELKALKEESHLEHVSSATSSFYASQCGQILGDTTNRFLQENARNQSSPSVEDSLGVTLKTLADERFTAHRPEQVEEMTTDQVKDEKLAIQKALLHFESIHSKPFTKAERNTIRPLYDRYRSVKKLLVRSGSFPGSVSKNKDLCSELQPILEHETMDFPSREQVNIEIVCEGAKEKIMESIPIEKELKVPVEQEDTKGTTGSCFLTKYDNSNFHELPLSEMIFQMQKVKSEKRHIRKILREFEAEFLRLNGRKVLKEDKAPVDTLYGEYKHVKARLKLLEALISKHDQHQLM